MMLPEDYRQADVVARGQGMGGIVGSYHSRSAPTAFLSIEDQEFSRWPGEQTIIVAFQNSEVGEIALYSHRTYHTYTGRLVRLTTNLLSGVN